MGIDYLGIHGFDIRVVNKYAPAVANETEQQKLAFYSTFKKAIIKTQKKQKLNFVGDFNATTSISKKQPCAAAKSATKMVYKCHTSTC